MRKLHTHYDNLKVARNAPVEVIRAAYRVLAQRYHPDVNSAPEAKHAMQLLNKAWEVLGDEKRRAEHDAWIAEQEKRAASLESHGTSSSMDGQTPGSADTRSPNSAKHDRQHKQPNSVPPGGGSNAASKGTSEPPRPRRRGYSLEPRRVESKSWLTSTDRWLTVAILSGVLIGLWWLVKPRSSSPPTPSAATQFSRTPSLPEPIKASGWKSPQEEFEARMAARERGTPFPDMALPSSDQAVSSKASSPDVSRTPTSSGPSRAAEASTQWSPNGKPWPSRAGYIKGLPVRAGGGLSKFTVDNTDGGSDVYVKLCRPSQERCDGLRHVFIPEGSSFTMTELASGIYEIRYRSLSTGAISKSEPMALRQVETDQRIRFSVLRLTLYRVRDGNTSFTNLTEDRF